MRRHRPVSRASVCVCAAPAGLYRTAESEELCRHAPWLAISQFCALAPSAKAGFWLFQPSPAPAVASVCTDDAEAFQLALSLPPG
jgi:hypothetical protein